MTDTSRTDILLKITDAALPYIIALIRGSVPAGTPPPTEAEILATLEHNITASLAKDEAWKLAHPPENDVGSDVPGGGAG